MKYQEPQSPTDPRRAIARRLGELLGSIPGGDATVTQWLRQLTFHLAVGNNDAHAEKIISGTLTALAGALVAVKVPRLISAGLDEQLRWNV